MQDGLYKITKYTKHGKTFGNLLVKDRFYVIMGDMEVEVEKRVFDKLEDGEEVALIHPSIFYERKGIPILVKELKC
tara:strand:+ start:1648 stop:1875 length:228 start_codon:yes stop_codon:yes gene_type:complete